MTDERSDQPLSGPPRTPPPPAPRNYAPQPVPPSSGSDPSPAEYVPSGGASPLPEQGRPADWGSPPSSGQSPSYGAPPGYGPPPSYGAPPGYGPPPSYGAPPGYGPPPSNGAPPGYGPPPSYGPPPGYGPPTAQQPPGGPPRRRRTGLVIGLVVLGAVVVAGIVVGAFLLFGSKTLDTAKAESEIGRITKEQFGLAPTDVHCPQDIPVKAGTSTDCTARLDGQSIGYTVQQTDDKGNVHISSQSIVTQVSKLQDELARGIGSQVGVTVQARCDTNGRQVIVGATAAPIRCTVTNTGNPTDTLDVDATLDDKGNATWKSVS